MDVIRCDKNGKRDEREVGTASKSYIGSAFWHAVICSECPCREKKKKNILVLAVSPLVSIFGCMLWRDCVYCSNASVMRCMHKCCYSLLGTLDTRIIVHLMCANKSLRRITIIFMMIIIVIIAVDGMKINLTVCSRCATQMKRWKNDNYSWQLMRGFSFYFYLITTCAKLCNNPNAICVINHVNYFSYARHILKTRIPTNCHGNTLTFVFFSVHGSQSIAAVNFCDWIGKSEWFFCSNPAH